jgi:hypothetical protein
MSEFNIGDKAIALSTATRPNQPRQKGRMYTVTGIYYCPTKGHQLINIDHTKSTRRTMRCGCGKIHNTEDNLSYTYADRFVKPEELDQRLEEAVEAEDYDTAITIRNFKARQHAED